MIPPPPNNKTKPSSIAWSPSIPYTVYHTQNNTLEATFSHSNVGCTPMETSTLLELLDAFIHSMDKKKELDVKNLARGYLKCLDSLMERMKEEEKECRNLPLLSSMYNTFHLSEIFLLRPMSRMRIPGYATSELVQYLRRHCVSELPLPEDWSWLEDGEEPELHPSYWNIVEYYIARGYTDVAWEVIQRHSRCRMCRGTGDEEGFVELYYLLKCAPLPGGKSLENGVASKEEEEEEEELFLDHTPVSSRSCKQWDDETTLLVAKSHWNTWSQIVQKCAGGVGLKGGLHHRIPELQRILDILAGNSIHVDCTWADMFLGELLYRNPAIVPRDVADRAQFYMGEKTNVVPNPIVLSIMRGDAGEAIANFIHLGGNTGAALPATLSALLCHLLTKANRIPETLNQSTKDDSQPIHLLSHLVLSAASSCLSSFSSTQSSIGIRCACRLLRLLSNPSTQVSYLVQFLSHAYPHSDAEANMSLQFIDDTYSLTTKPSDQIQLLETASGIAMTRAQYYLTQSRPSGAAHWFLRSMQLQHRYSSGERQGLSMAHSTFASICHSIARDLLLSLPQKPNESVIDYAQEMLRSIRSFEDDSDNMHPYILSVIAFLQNAMSIVVHWDTDPVLVIQSISACLEDRKESAGVPLSPPTLWMTLMKLADVILVQQDQLHQEKEKCKDTPIVYQDHLFTDDATSEKQPSDSEAPTPNNTLFQLYNTDFIHLLMTRFAEMELDPSPALTPTQIQDMKTLLAKHLAKAYVLENARRKVPYQWKQVKPFHSVEEEVNVLLTMNPVPIDDMELHLLDYM